MYWWQIAIRLILIANGIGNLYGAIRAGRERDWNRLHWLVSKTIGWTMFSFALLSAHYGGIGSQHWEAIAGTGLTLLLYGVAIEKTASSWPRIEWLSVELPHVGRIDGALIPLLMVALAILSFLLFVADIIYRHHVTTGIVIILVSLPLLLSFSIRLLLRQYNLTRMSDLVELVKFRPRPIPTPAQHDWIKSNKDDAAS